MANIKTGIILVALIFSLLFIGFISWLLYRANNLETIPDTAFSIALAEVADKSSRFNRSSKQTTQISNMIYDTLCDNLQKELSETPCIPSPDKQTKIQVKRIGVMSSRKEARDWGNTIGAEIVLWGEFRPHIEEDKNFSVRFELLATDKSNNPEFMFILPLTNPIFEMETSLGISDSSFEKPVKQRTIVISSFILGLRAYLKRDFSQATAYFESAEQNLTKNTQLSDITKSTIYFYLGRAYQKTGDVAKGQTWLNQAKTFNPQEPAIPLGLALGYGALGDEISRDNELNEALTLIDTFNPQEKTSINAAHYDAGVIHWINKDYQAAINQFQQVVDSEADYRYVAAVNLGKVYTDMEDYEAAQQALQRAIQIAKADNITPAWAYVYLAVAHEKAKAFEEAELAYQTAISIAKTEFVDFNDDTLAWMYYYYARFLEKEERWDEAKAIYYSLTENIPQWGEVWAYGTLTEFLRKQQAFEETIAVYQELAPCQYKRMAPLCTGLAQTHAELGNLELAQQSFAQAINLDNQRIRTYFDILKQKEFFY